MDRPIDHIRVMTRQLTEGDELGLRGQQLFGGTLDEDWDDDVLDEMAMTPGSVDHFLFVLTSKVTQADKRLERRQPNIYRLGHWLKAVSDTKKRVAGVLHSSDKADLMKLKKALSVEFTSDFTPANFIKKAIDKFLATGRAPKITGRAGTKTYGEDVELGEASLDPMQMMRSVNKKIKGSRYDPKRWVLMLPDGAEVLFARVGGKAGSSSMAVYRSGKMVKDIPISSPDDAVRKLREDVDLDEAMFRIGDRGLTPVETGRILIQPDTFYHMGASTSPDQIFVTRVTDKHIYYKTYPYKKEALIDRRIGEDLIFRGVTMWMKQGYAQDSPDRAKYKMLMAGKGVKATKLANYMPVTVIAVPATGYEDQDLWRAAERYGSVGGFHPEGGDKGPMRYEIRHVAAKDVVKLRRDKRFKVLKTQKESVARDLRDQLLGDVELDEGKTIHTLYIDWLKSKHSDRLVKGTELSGAKRSFKTLRAPQLAMVEWRKGDKFVRAILSVKMGIHKITVVEGEYVKGGPTFSVSSEKSMGVKLVLGRSGTREYAVQFRYEDVELDEATGQRPKIHQMDSGDRNRIVASLSKAFPGLKKMLAKASLPGQGPGSVTFVRNADGDEMITFMHLDLGHTDVNALVAGYRSAFKKRRDEVWGRKEGRRIEVTVLFSTGFLGDALPSWSQKMEDVDLDEVVNIEGPVYQMKLAFPSEMKTRMDQQHLGTNRENSTEYIKSQAHVLKKRYKEWTTYLSRIIAMARRDERFKEAAAKAKKADASWKKLLRTNDFMAWNSVALDMGSAQNALYVIPSGKREDVDLGRIGYGDAIIEMRDKLLGD